MSALLPPALLLLWSGLAATLFASFLLAPLFDIDSAGLAPAIRRPTVAMALLCGVLAYPLLYGALFTLLREASLVTGAIAGLGHAAVHAARNFRQGGGALVRQNRDRLMLRILYGALLGFVFVTP